MIAQSPSIMVFFNFSFHSLKSEEAFRFCSTATLSLQQPICVVQTSLPVFQAKKKYPLISKRLCKVCSLFPRQKKSACRALFISFWQITRSVNFSCMHAHRKILHKSQVFSKNGGEKKEKRNQTVKTSRYRSCMFWNSLCMLKTGRFAGL